VSDEQARSGPDGGGQDRDVLGIGKLAGLFTLVRGRTMNRRTDRAEKLLEEWDGVGELGGQIASDFRHRGLREDQTEETQLAENQNRVAGPCARQQAGDQNVSVETDG